MLKGKDRRQTTRYKAGKLIVEVKPRGDEGRPNRVRGLDFNSYGLSFHSAALEFGEGQPLILNLQLDNIQLLDIHGVVRYAAEDRIGVQFDFTSPNMHAEYVLDGLDKIERLLHNSRASVVPTGVRKMRKRDRYSDKR